MTKIINYLRAGCPILYIQTYEEDRVIRTISKFDRYKYEMWSWNIIDGFVNIQDSSKRKDSERYKDIINALLETTKFPEQSIIFFKDLHRYLKTTEIYRVIKNLIPTLKTTDKHIIIIAPTIEIPVELEKDVVVIDFALPSLEDIRYLVEQMIKENNLKIKIDNAVLQSMRGLTLQEAENAIALSLIEKKELDKEIIEREKFKIVRENNAIELYESVDQQQLGGLNNLKQYLYRRRNIFNDSSSPLRGILLLGVPGAGKSLAAKVTAKILNVSLIRLDLSLLKGSLVGETEHKTKQTLKLIDALSPCVVWIDEIEKVFGGVISSNRTDGGVTMSMFGSVLIWMQESKYPKYIVATCNNITDLLSISQGALLRRFDDIFFVDFPNKSERKEILRIMNNRYNCNISEEYVEKMQYWTGAEIERFVIASKYEGIDEAFKNIRPIYNQNREQINTMRDWAQNNARFANSED